MQWGDLITLEYGKPIKDKESVDGPIPVYGTNGQIGTSHLKPLCEHPSFILGRKGAYRGVHYSDTPFSVIDTAFYAQSISDKVDLKWAYGQILKAFYLVTLPIEYGSGHGIDLSRCGCQINPYLNCVLCGFGIIESV